jgi:MFS transporter, FHS family, L-fucose permease
LTNNLLESQVTDLSFVVKAYMAVGLVGLIVGIVILIKKFPVHKDSEDFGGLGASFGRLMKNGNFKFSVIAQFFYVAAQIGVFTYITPYFVEYHTGVSTKDDAASYAIAGMILFILGRFIGTALMKKFDPARILTFMASTAAILMIVSILVKGNVGAMSIVLSFTCMSICFPTIYGLGLTGVGDDRKLGGSFIIMAIVGGAVLVPVQAILVDTFNVATSFAMPLVGFILVAIYGIVAHKKEAEIGILHEGES